ncbi:MAG: sodium:proton exchanger [Acidobacteriota bacterium]|nr:sodium:proton exchanger [Acidobacteriota bacterium]
MRRGDRRLIAITALLVTGSALTRFVSSGRVAPFVVSALALAGLAALVGRSVDGLGDRLGSGATGVLQSALGNIPELLFGFFALRKGLVTVVQAALVGSVLANVLLVLGVAVIVGGARNGTQRFAAEGPRITVLLLLLSVAILLVPTVTAHLHTPAASHEQALSNTASVVLLLVFALAVPMSLRRAGPAGGEDAGFATAVEGPPWPLGLAIGLLAGASVGAAFVSDWFVTALTPALSAMHISEAFAGLVIVAIAGNAVENVVGIQLAARNRMDYALSVTLQSPVQVALAVAPVLVLLSPVIGGATLSLVFPPLLVVALAITAVVAVVVVFDGESTWLEGVCLVGLYVVVATAFWWG